MAWIYLAESEELPSACPPGSIQSPTVSRNRFRNPFYYHARLKDYYRQHPSGTIYGHWVANGGQTGLSTLSTEDGRAKTQSSSQTITELSAYGNLVPRTAGRDGLRWPTPRASDWKDWNSSKKGSKMFGKEANAVESNHHH